MSTLLLVRNSVDHDARVLRAARVAGQTLEGTALVVGAATATASVGATIVDGIGVVRVAARPPALARLRRPSWPAGLSRLSEPARKHPGSDRVDERVLDETVSSSPRLTLTARARRILSGASFALQALSLARRVKPTLVHANDWNTMWCGLAIKFTCGSRLIYDSHELWADRNGRWEWRPWLVVSEALFVRIADEVITSSPGYADALAARYRVPKPEVVRNIPENGTHSRIAVQPDRVLPNGASSVLMAASRAMDTNDLHKLPAANDSHKLPAASGPPSPARILYMGGLMPGRGLEQMIDALPLIQGIRLCAIGPGALQYRERLLARAAAAGVEDRVELQPPVAPGEVGRVLRGATVGLCLIQPVCRSYELCLPNKLFEYAAAGVPILASNVPVIAAVVRGGELGEVVAPDDPYAIAAGLERLLQPKRWKLVAERVSGFAAAHDWAGEACALTGAYERAVGERAA